MKHVAEEHLLKFLSYSNNNGKTLCVISKFLIRHASLFQALLFKKYRKTYTLFEKQF
jgi:hypothetical protein